MEQRTRDCIPFVAPFAAWIALQMALPATAASYAIRTMATAMVGVASIVMARHLFARQDAATKRPSAQSLVVGIICGLAVCVLWIAPEYSTWYRTWLEMPFGTPPPPPAPSPYEPETCGWPLTLAKLAGSAFVIAPAEEMFFRSFLYRRLQARDFRAVPLSRFDLSAFLWTVFLFTLEHDRPLVAALAGAAYGMLAIRFGIASAITAHIVTNLALGLHVICRGEWWFW